MPIQIRENEFVQFKFEPLYLKEVENIRTNTETLCKANQINPKLSDIVLDGGNVLRWDDRVIISSRIYKENPNFLNKEKLLIRTLETELGVEVIVIPEVKCDMTGHADGIVRFISRNTLIVNNLSSEYKYWATSMSKFFKHSDFEFYEMPIFEYKIPKFSYNAIGCYVNYLEIGNLIIFPIFEIEGYKYKDKEALKIIHSLFPNKAIEPININEIAKHGGLMNCISWNIKK